MNRLPVRERAQVPHAICEGMSLRACERVFDRPMRTVVKIVEEVGDMAIRFHQQTPPVRAEFIRPTSFGPSWGGTIAARTGSGKMPMLNAVFFEGVTWTYLGIERSTNLVLAYHLGTRRAVDASLFMHKLASRLDRDDHGRFVVRPTIAMDGLKAYRDAIELAFGDDVNAGVFDKRYDKLDENGEPFPYSRYTGADRKSVCGNPQPEEINTWRVERENGFMRQADRRFTRKTNGFSKRLEFHERQVAIWMLYRNYCWVPRPRRPKDGSFNWEKRVTAAMAAGLTDRVWDIDELVERTDAFVATRHADTPEGIAQPIAGVEEESSFWVNHSPNHRRAKVHTAGCTTRNKALASEGDGVREGSWIGFATEAEAVAHAERLEPDHHAVCRRCMGSYVTLHTYGRRH